jgi:ATP-binding cassette subfamily B protein
MFTLRKLTDNVDITIFVISHDLKMVMDFDEIIILNNGRIEAIGKHNQLINTSVWYKNALEKMN